MLLQSLLSRTIYWRTRRAVELAASGVRLAHKLTWAHSRVDSGFQLIPSQARHEMTPALFWSAFRVYPGLPMPGGASLATRRCPDCLEVVDPFGAL